MYDGKGGSIYRGAERQAKVAELQQKSADAMQTSRNYESMGGYSGHAAEAARQAVVLNTAAAKAANGQPICDYEQRGYNG